MIISIELTPQAAAERVLANLCRKYGFLPVSATNAKKAIVQAIREADEGGNEATAQAAGQKREAEVLAALEAVTIT